MAGITFIVKNSGRPDDHEGFRLRLPAESSTVRDVKLKLQQEYPGAPHPDSITVSSARIERRADLGARWTERQWCLCIATCCSLIVPFPLVPPFCPDHLRRPRVEAG